MLLKEEKSNIKQAAIDGDLDTLEKLISSGVNVTTIFVVSMCIPYNYMGLMYSADWTHGLDSRTGLADSTGHLLKSCIHIQTHLKSIIN